jgi:hypothetical protein
VDLIEHRGELLEVEIVAFSRAQHTQTPTLGAAFRARRQGAAEMGAVFGIQRPVVCRLWHGANIAREPARRTLAALAAIG